MFSDNTNSILKLDPRTKLAILMASMVFSLNNLDVLSAIICIVFLGVLIFLEGDGFTAVKWLTGCSIVLLIFNGIIISGNTSSLTMICAAIMVMIKVICPVLMALALFTKTTKMADLISAFQKMHLPMTFVIPFIVMIRFMPTVSDEWESIKKAMLFRGIKFDLKNLLLKPAQTIEYILVPLLFSSMSLMEELASSAMARGLDSNKKRSCYSTVKMKISDYLILFSFLGFVVISLIKFQ
ncbi:MAG: energy-coupling factor transporter transmembrane component T [Spirochaetales bacterium]|nr:energy-coupling factor transporter transmembrane component T [Spirochaetales bacterium]